MTREELEEMSYSELVELCIREIYTFTFFEALKDFAIEQTQNDNLSLAIHILSAIDVEPSEYYLYDYCMGTMETPKPLDYEDMIGLLVDDEDESEE